MAKGGKDVRETADEKESARIAGLQQERYTDKFLPLERDLIADVRDTRPERQQALGTAAIENTRAFAAAKPKVEGALTNAGAGPGSGRFNLAVTGMGDDEGLARGSSLVGANNAVDDQYYAGMQSLAELGRGQQADAVQGLSEVANMSRRQAVSDATLSAQNRAAWADAAGGLAGVAAANYKSGGGVNNGLSAAPAIPSAGGTYTPSWSEAAPSAGGTSTAAWGGTNPGLSERYGLTQYRGLTG